jgi:hypothetical protein
MAANLAASWVTDMNKKVSSYSVPTPEINSDYACADCDSPPPPKGTMTGGKIPAGSVIEGFCSSETWSLVGALGILGVIMYLVQRRRR